MKLKRLLVMSMAALSILMVGCQNDKNSSDTVSTSSQSVSESMDINTYHETIPVPVEGWTAEELAKTIRINGEPIEMPFTIDSLGTDYQIDENVSSWLEEKKTLTASLLYKGEHLATVVIGGVESGDFDIASSLKVVRIGVFHSENSQMNHAIAINGVSIGATSEYIRSVLGEPIEIDGKNLVYKDKETQNKIAVFGINEDNIVNVIYVNFIDE